MRLRTLLGGISNETYNTCVLRVLVVLLFVVMLGVGYGAYTQLNIEAYPDPVPPPDEDN